MTLPAEIASVIAQLKLFLHSNTMSSIINDGTKGKFLKGDGKTLKMTEWVILENKGKKLYKLNAMTKNWKKQFYKLKRISTSNRNFVATVEGTKCVARPHASISAPSSLTPVRPTYSPVRIAQMN